MKKTLLATTLLVATAGLAAAEVTLSGYGRFGLVYTDDGATSDTVVATRLRFNIDAKLESDAGITFGGRIRLQHSSGSDAYGTGYGGAQLNAAMLYMEASGFRVEVGNANTAYDSAGLYYNSEIGFTDNSLGESQDFEFYGYSSGPYDPAEVDRMGIFVSYAVGDLAARLSYVDPDQTAGGDDPEVSVSIDYSSGPFSVSLAAAQDGLGIAGNDLFFIGAAYAIGDSTNVGLNYYDEDEDKIITLYANHTMASGLTVAGYISDLDDGTAASDDIGLGIGASYPLGDGAKMSGAYHKRGDVVYADLGVRFDF